MVTLQKREGVGCVFFAGIGWDLQTISDLRSRLIFREKQYEWNKGMFLEVYLDVPLEVRING